MSDHIDISPYLCQPLNRSYRDFLNEEIARLEAESRCLDEWLDILREERKRLGAQAICLTDSFTTS